MKRQEELSKRYKEKYKKNMTINNTDGGHQVSFEGPKEMMEFNVPEDQPIDKQELAKIRLMLMSLYEDTAIK